MENLVNEEIEQTRNRWEEDGRKEYKVAADAKREMDYYKKNPEELNRYVEHTYRATLGSFRDKVREEKTLELKEKRIAELSNRTPENYLKNCKERLDKLKQELGDLPSMDLKKFKNEIYDKSPEKIKEMTDERDKPIPGSYLSNWYNAIIDGQKWLSWKQLPLESARKLFTYKNLYQLKGYKEYNEQVIERIEATFSGFLKVAIENKDIESVVDSAILLKKLDNLEIISFVKEQMEELQKSPEKADKEKLISISEKISQIEK